MEALVCLDFGLLLGDAGKSFLPGAAADRLRGYAGRAHEGSTHTVTVTKTRFSSDEVDGVSTLLYHQSGCFDAEPFNRFGRRLTRLRTKRTAELTWTEMRGIGERQTMGNRGYSLHKPRRSECGQISVQVLVARNIEIDSLHADERRQDAVPQIEPRSCHDRFLPLPAPDQCSRSSRLKSRSRHH